MQCLVHFGNDDYPRLLKPSDEKLTGHFSYNRLLRLTRASLVSSTNIAKRETNIHTRPAGNAHQHLQNTLPKNSSLHFIKPLMRHRDTGQNDTIRKHRLQAMCWDKDPGLLIHTRQ